MLKIHNLQGMRDDRILFSNVSIMLQPSQALQIFGPNGVGKSTLLRQIARQQDCQHACYIGHENNLHPALTVIQNLKFLQELLVKHAGSKKLCLTQALQYFDMHHACDIKSNLLSAGQQQRVSLARLLLTDASLWLLDEPIANLDAQAQTLFLKLCEQHLHLGGIIICATHVSLNFGAVHTQLMQLEDYA